MREEVEYADDLLEAIEPQVAAYDDARREANASSCEYNVRRLADAQRALAEAVWKRSHVRRAS